MVAYASISKTLHNATEFQEFANMLLTPPFRRPFTTDGVNIVISDSCLRLHFEDPSQPIDLFSPIKPNVYRAKQPFETARKQVNYTKSAAEKSCKTPIIAKNLQVAYNFKASHLIFSPRASTSFKHPRLHSSVVPDNAPLSLSGRISVALLIS